MKINQKQENNVLAKEQLTIVDIANMTNDSEKTNYYLENISIIGSLKGYSVKQKTEDYTFWKNHTILFSNSHQFFDLKFSFKSEKIESFEVDCQNIKELSDMLATYLGDNVKMLFSNRIFFTYAQESILMLLNAVLDFVLSE